MDKISDIVITDCINSPYVRPARMLYCQDGKKKVWDLMKVHDSVSVIIFNISRDVLVFVRQFRPAVYYNRVAVEDIGNTVDSEKYPSSLGMTIELCAGIVDKDKSLEEITQEEILEECGYDVDLSAIEKVTSYRSGVGVAGSLQTLFYTEVNDAMKVADGGGNSHEGEYIEVVEMSITEAYKMIFNEDIQKPPSLMFALMWFFANRQSEVPSKL